VIDRKFDHILGCHIAGNWKLAFQTVMADEIISPSDLGIDKAALTEGFIDAAATGLAVAYLAVQSLFQVRPVSAQQ
jgi:hypothetical protein